MLLICRHGTVVLYIIRKLWSNTLSRPDKLYLVIKPVRRALLH